MEAKKGLMLLTLTQFIVEPFAGSGGYYIVIGEPPYQLLPNWLTTCSKLFKLKIKYLINLLTSKCCILFGKLLHLKTSFFIQTTG